MQFSYNLTVEFILSLNNIKSQHYLYLYSIWIQIPLFYLGNKLEALDLSWLYTDPNRSDRIFSQFMYLFQKYSKFMKNFEKLCKKPIPFHRLF